MIGRSREESEWRTRRRSWEPRERPRGLPPVRRLARMGIAAMGTAFAVAPWVVPVLLAGAVGYAEYRLGKRLDEKTGRLHRRGRQAVHKRRRGE